MKLVMTLLVRNEEDIIKQNIDFHLECGVDHIVAIDNNSTDRTRAILSEFERSGLVTIIDEPGNDFSQSKWVTRAALFARDELGADWIINNDADEFWWCADMDLKARLRTTSADFATCQRRNMVYAYDDQLNDNWSNRLVYRIKDPRPIVPPDDLLFGPLTEPYFYSSLPPKALVRAKHLISVHQGNHNARFANGDAQAFETDIQIYHFPARGRQQLEQKVRQGGAAYARNTQLPKSAGWHWRRWYRLIQESGIDAVLSDALPSKQRLSQDEIAGSVIKDRAIQSILRSIETRS